MNKETTKQSEGNGNAGRTILLMLMVFVAPVVIIQIWFMLNPNWQPNATSNKGELIQPSRLVEFPPLLDLKNQTIDLSLLAKKWVLVTIASSNCLETCQKNIYHMRQITIAQGEERKRVQRLLLLTDDSHVSQLQSQLSDYPNMIVAKIPTQDLEKVLTLFTVADSEPAITAQRIYIIDPLSYLILSYLPDANPQGLLQDLKRLLKLSRIG